ncbi:MAG: phosphocholine cytidylyltransferase family protein [Candidatus Diapherotrites archaeon]|nr:phosphocholine cytidylyltransferase family protein [Candidatus Diapherotrites archaeon]
MSDVAIILAAGLGSRLREYTKNMPKALLPLDSSVTIFDLQVKSLLSQGVVGSEENIFVVAGWHADVLREHIAHKGYRVELLENPHYSNRNNSYSLYYALSQISEAVGNVGSVFLVNGDFVGWFAHYASCDRCPMGFCVVVDDVKRLGDEEMKVAVDERGQVAVFSKRIDPSVAVGEYIGVAKFPFKSVWNDGLWKSFEQSVGFSGWYEDFFNQGISSGAFEIFPVYVGGLPWVEVDFPDDYARARRIYQEYGSILPGV